MGHEVDNKPHTSETLATFSLPLLPGQHSSLATPISDNELLTNRKVTVPMIPLLTSTITPTVHGIRLRQRYRPRCLSAASNGHDGHASGLAVAMVKLQAVALVTAVTHEYPSCLWPATQAQD